MRRFSRVVSALLALACAASVSIHAQRPLDPIAHTLRFPPGATPAQKEHFSIVIGDQPEMDFGGRRNPDGQGFAVFGRVVSGMDVVRAIQKSPTGPRGP